MGSSIVGIQAEDLENQESEEEHWVFPLGRSGREREQGLVDPEAHRSPLLLPLPLTGDSPLQPLTASAMVEGQAGRGHFMRGEGVSTLNLQKMLKAP